MMQQSDSEHQQRLMREMLPALMGMQVATRIAGLNRIADHLDAALDEADDLLTGPRRPRDES